MNHDLWMIFKVSKNPHNLYGMLQQLAVKSGKVGLSMNTTKTKIISNHMKQKIEINNIIEYLNEYLGHLGHQTDRQSETRTDYKKNKN